jgi:hypothetical protein
MLKFWQVIAAILIFYVGHFLMLRGQPRTASDFLLAIAIWVLISALVWVVCYFAFRAVDKATHD